MIINISSEGTYLICKNATNPMKLRHLDAIPIQLTLHRTDLLLWKKYNQMKVHDMSFLVN